jgi:hypothetical protein
LERAYEVYEFLENTYIREDSSETVPGIIDNWTETYSHGVRQINPFPVAVAEGTFTTGANGVAPSMDVLAEQLVGTNEYKTLFRYIFPLNRFFTLLCAYTIQGTSSMEGVKFAFDTTKEELFKLKSICDNSGDYTYSDPNIVCMGNAPGIKRAADNMASLLDGCFSLDADACMRGAGLTFPIKWMLQTPKYILRGIIELISPNIAIAKMISALLKLAGICLPMPVISFALLPIDIFLPPPIGIGIGPPLYPLGHAYHMMGFGQIDLSLGGASVELEAQAEVGLAKEEVPCPDDDSGGMFMDASITKAEAKVEPPQSSTAQKMAVAVKLVKEQQAKKVKEETDVAG